MGFGTAEVSLVAAAPKQGETWWSAYASELASSGIGETGRRVIAADAREVVDQGIFGAGAPGDERWPEGRIRTGAVMGAVQSGKTASMIAVTALALDAGVDAVVVLGGTRTALWLQTAERVFGQLDVLTHKTKRRYVLPNPASLATSRGADAAAAYRLTSQEAARAVDKRRPLIAVVMKNVAHLAEMAATLHDELYPAASDSGRPFHLLVIDDEADDSSVVDDEGFDPSQVRQVPRRIRDLWESRRHEGETAAPHLYATYVAYTATPQANFLQDPDNPLAPRDFFASLRTPGPEGDWATRSPTYRVLEGARAWYTGGQIYYRALAEVPLCTAIDPADDPQALLIDAVRAYLVASAVRVLRQPDRAGPATALGRVYGTAEAAKAGVVGPMSMLVHPSSAKERHFESAALILGWAAGVDPSEGRKLLDAGARQLSVEGVRQDIEATPQPWLRWLADYRRSAEVVSRTMEIAPPPAVPGPEDWAEMVRTILDEVVPGTAVAVINSDENADDRPHFSPAANPDGTWRAATNLSTIFVSGNVMSRGLTLEGLTTTYFSRRSDEPLADTQMQMQRWFGYRGAYIDLCRVVLTAEQLELFEQYHENDEALRRDVLAAMSSGDSARPPLAVLQGRRFLATGKIGNLRSVPLWPGPKPFIRHMNPAGADGLNLETVEDLFRDADVLPVPTGRGRQGGVVLDRPLDLLATAELLDRLRYVNHRPGRAGAEADRWKSVENHAGLDGSDPAWPLYRPPVDTSGGRDLGTASPYWIAAYLRLWAAALDRRIPGMYTTDEPPVAWRLVDLATKAQQQPRFSIGLRFGDGERLDDGPLSRLPFDVYGMKRRAVGDELQSGWGARGAGAGGIRGDEFFDLRARGDDLASASDGPRSAGSNGQVLFHVVERHPAGISLAVGVVLPLGGPDNVEARTGRGEQA